jgi:hypothetical protein
MNQLNALFLLGVIPGATVAAETGTTAESEPQPIGQLRLRRSGESGGSRWGVSCCWIAGEHPLGVRQRLDHLAALGAKWAMLAPDWNRVERKKGKYDRNTPAHRLDDVVIRAKPDNVIKAICDKGGVMGICFIRGFLGGSGDIAAVLDHIDYLVKHFGPDHAAVGMDIGYSCRPSGESKKMVVSPRGRARWESCWPKETNSGGSHRSLAWTNWPMLTVGLVQRGYSDQNIQKILGGNVLRVARETWKARPELPLEIQHAGSRHGHT